MIKQRKYYIFLGLGVILLSVSVYGLSVFTKINASANGSSVSPADKVPPEAQLGQNFVVGIPGPTLDAGTKTILQYIKPGGIVLYYRNFQSPEQLTKLISDLQQVAEETTNHDYFIMIDEEPGGAERLGLFQNVFAFGEPNWTHIEHDVAVMQKLGITVDLAPVADFPFNGDSFIAERVPAHTVSTLTTFDSGFISL